MVDKYTVFTDLDCIDIDRLEIRIHGNSATVHFGGHFKFEINRGSKIKLKNLVEVYAEIFKAAADSL